ncbi:hypothetical protein CHGG_06317 [Chaetomium globosum CBS 148.51]|uniref:Uncharacterized protein n=1 Tax=Chaetomium globosum (strain ATCC 6205 / CBS 148.51 / DSM 1962 / NBRC 6347 / NRRL 1970) TaxID=306901 RepID=Q2H4U8_CHAGB|nr:uncharacterized protein CHGG_06317 [Chaetomium globosum CBS 148.51]EAQ89698.1 hypothetical protein CHGG_06317 [Chaetomium globosum CBS 148.51]
MSLANIAQDFPPGIGNFIAITGWDYTLHLSNRRPEILIQLCRRVEGSLREPPSFAFAFDIDGVLLHVAKPIPGATKVLKFLNDNNIPFILLTNGGGKHETERVKDLEARLGVELSTDNFVQSHTPFQELLEGPNSLRDKTVLVTGSDYEKCRTIFKEYGFQKRHHPRPTSTPTDPTIFPFQSPSPYTTPLPNPSPNPSTPTQAPSSTPPPSPPTSKSTPSSSSTTPATGPSTYKSSPTSSSPTPATSAPTPHSTTPPTPPPPPQRTPKKPIKVKEVGKTTPNPPSTSATRTCSGAPATTCPGWARARSRPPWRGCGDGLRAGRSCEGEGGAEWVSVLVRTGVWSAERGGKLEGVFEPKVVVDDVMAAVKWALKKEGWEKGPVGEEMK